MFIKPDHYSPCQTSTIDYYPFGQEMPGRVNYATLYRNGFNGKEKDNEVVGTCKYPGRPNNLKIY